MDESDPAIDSPPRRRWRMRVSLVAGTVAGLAVLGVWSQRAPIAAGFVDRELAARGVRARYTVDTIGLRRQRLENVVIGDPASPDLTARAVEIDIAFGLDGPRLVAARAEGLRLRGRLVGGTVRLGEVDKLLPPPSGKPFALPDLIVGLADARMRLELPGGTLALRLDGTGRLTDGFAGRLAAVGERLAVGGCTLAAPSAFVTVRVADRAPRGDGPLRFAGARCGGVLLAPGSVLADVRLGAALDRWRGRLTPQLGGVAAGDVRVGGIGGAVDFNGSRIRTSGTGRLDLASVAVVGMQARGVRLAGGFLLGSAGEHFNGTVAVARAALPPGWLARASALAGSAEGTPAGPLLDRLALAATRAGRSFGGRAAVIAMRRAGTTAVALNGLDLRSASGAAVTLAGGDGLRLHWPGGAPRIDGVATLSGGDLPSVRARLSGTAGALGGTIEVARYTGRGAALELQPTRFTSAGGVTRFTTTATLSGPLGDGRVDGLVLPVAGTIGARGQLAINPACTPVAFARLQVAGLVLDPARLRLCPVAGALVTVDGGRVRGGARIAAPRLSGRLGSTPLTLAAAGSDISLERGGFAIDGLAARLGAAGRQTRLDFGRLEGAVTGGAVGGSFASTGGQIGNVPLILSEAGGRWRLAGGVLEVTGATAVSDAESANPRFRPVRVPDVALRLADDTITATGTLTEPASGTKLSDLAIVHRLGPGSGEARLAVPGITFDKALQPEQLTPLTLGVVANVRGTVSGAGRIAWDADGVTSGGRFTTQGMDLAAAFGPVSGLSTTIEFTDLLGLVSAPAEATLGEVNPGIAVTDGAVRYRLLEGQRVGIDRGSWPFAGGTLALQPTVLDFGENTQRRLTFAVTALDAAKFIQAMEFENIAATGIFDGSLPMIFDDAGGRIEGGSLTVRPGGGRLAYVGEVSNADLGMFAKLAFDALKAIRYDRLTIDLDGALDGEIVSRIRFNGVNQGTPEADRSALLKQFTGLPFRFNITIRAPFRGLVSTARSFTDPSGLIRDQLPQLPQANASSPDSTVQPQESTPAP